MLNLSTFLVRSAAWWILYVVTPLSGWAWSLAWFLVAPFSRQRACQLAEFLQMRLVPFFLLEFIAWPLAVDFLRAKLEAEKHLLAYDYWQSVKQDEENGRQP